MLPHLIICASFAVRPMMYGYGDSDQPLPETVDLVEVRRQQF